MSKKGRFAALCLFALAVCANGLFYGLAHDEGVTVDIAVGRIEPALVKDFGPVPISELQACVNGSTPRSADRVVNELTRRVNPYPPGYFLVMRAWTALAGVHRVSLRLPSVLFGLATLLGLAFLARRLIPGSYAGMWIVMLAALSPWLTAISSFARPYAFVLAIGTWSTVVALDMARGDTRTRARVLFVALSLLGIYTLYHYGFVIAWQCLFLAVAARHSGSRSAAGTLRRDLGVLVLMGAAIALGFAPWASYLPGHLELTSTMPSYYLGPVTERIGFKSLRVLWTFFLGDVIAGPVRYGLVIAFLVLGGSTLLLLLRRSPPTGDARQDAVARVFFCTIIFYPALILAGDLAHGTRTLTISKTSFMLFPILMLLVLRAWSSLPRPGMATAGLMAWILLIGSSAVATTASHLQRVDHHRVIAASLAADDKPDHYVLVNSMVRGHAIPLLLTLEECGVRNVQFVFAPPPQLDRVLEETIARKNVRRITLLNLHSVYAHDVATYCDREQIDALARCARKGGWRVSRSTPDQYAAQLTAATPSRRFDILSPVW